MATIKQRRLAKLVASSSNMKEAMVKAGYSPNTAVKPTQVTGSKAWPELLEKYLPDAKLLEKHGDALEATKQDQYTGEISPDHAIRLRGVELGYKVKKKLGEANVNIFGDKVIAILGGKSTDVPSDNSNK